MDDGLASYTIGRAAEREIGVRRRLPGYEPSPYRPHEARWAQEGPVQHPRDLDTVRLWLTGDGETTPPAEALNDQKGSG